MKHRLSSLSPLPVRQSRSHAAGPNRRSAKLWARRDIDHWHCLIEAPEGSHLAMSSRRLQMRAHIDSMVVLHSARRLAAASYMAAARPAPPRPAIYQRDTETAFE